MFPGVLLLTMLIVQAALFWHAESAALAGAQQGLAVARSAGVPAGVARATSVVSTLGGIGSPAASGTSGAQLVVQVKGVAPSIVPGLNMSVTESASGPAESYQAP